MSDVVSEVVRILTEVVGEDFLLDTEITERTTFSDDLALESIEFVALAERLQARYGDRVNLIEFIGAKDIDDIMAMTVGELARYIEAVEAQPAGPR
ncbi:MAG TPA: phosphopantetheine-binding protein [Streptosporangiaceae bacterium]|nr:phosphopantetheine-binding protein [Streptosporangiaceae bacterium]